MNLFIDYDKKYFNGNDEIRKVLTSFMLVMISKIKPEEIGYLLIHSSLNQKL